MTPSQEERLAVVEKYIEFHSRRLDAFERKFDSIYGKFETYLPRWVTVAGVGMGAMLGSSLTVIAILTGG